MAALEELEKLYKALSKSRQVAKPDSLSATMMQAQPFYTRDAASALSLWRPALSLASIPAE